MRRMGGVEEVWSVSPTTRGVGLRGGVAHSPESGSGIRGRMGIPRSRVHRVCGVLGFGSGVAGGGPPSSR